MSIAAINWAMDQKTDGPSAQSVLFIIADRANEHGVCRHADPDTIAQKTRQSRATVFRRLEEGERVGLLTRFTRHLDDGRREYEVRLAMQCRVNYRVDKHRNITLYSVDDEKCELDRIGYLPFEGNHTQDIDSGSQIETHGESQIATHQQLQSENTKVAPVRLGESQSCDSQKSPSKNPSKEDSPPTPQAGGGNVDIEGASEAIQPTEIEGWESFKAAFEADNAPILRVSLAKGLFAALKPEERTLVTNAARGLIAHRKGEKKPGMKPAAQTFLREIEAWPGYAKFAPPEVTPPTFIAEHSPEDLALRILDRILNRASQQMKFDVAQGVNGWWRTVPVPLDLLGLSIFADKPIEQWCPVESDSKPLFAWLDRIVKWTGNRPDLQRILTGGEHPFTYNGQTTMIKNYVMGLRVPHPFPPRKDGTISSSTDPPKESSAA